MRCWANQFSRGGNNLQGECLYRLGENQQQATFKHLLQTDPNLSIEPLHDYDQTALFVVPFPPLPLLPGERQIFGSLANLFPPRSKRRRRRRPRASRQEASRQARTRWGLDPPRLFLHSTRRSTWRRSWTSIFAPRLPLKPPWFIFRSRNFILGEKNSVFMYFLDVYFVQASLSRFFFFFRSKGEEKSAMSEELNVYFFPLLDLSLYYFVSKGRISFFIFHTYRLLIDEVENNVKILKLISKLSERYEISDGE